MDKEAVIKQLGINREFDLQAGHEYWQNKFYWLDNYNGVHLHQRIRFDLTPDDIKALNYIVEHPEEFFEANP